MLLTFLLEYATAWNKMFLKSVFDLNFRDCIQCFIFQFTHCGRLCRPQRSLRDADRLRTPGSMSSYMAYMSSCNGDISALNVSILLDDLLRPFKLSLLNSLTDDQWWSEIRWWLKTTTICALCKIERAQFKKKKTSKRVILVFGPFFQITTYSRAD